MTDFIPTSPSLLAQCSEDPGRFLRYIRQRKQKYTCNFQRVRILEHSSSGFRIECNSSKKMKEKLLFLEDGYLSFCPPCSEANLFQHLSQLMSPQTTQTSGYFFFLINFIYGTNTYTQFSTRDHIFFYLA